jgi:hypothetical protein
MVEEVEGVDVHVSVYTAVNVVAAVIEKVLYGDAEPVSAQWEKA